MVKVCVPLGGDFPQAVSDMIDSEFAGACDTWGVRPGDELFAAVRESTKAQVNFHWSSLSGYQWDCSRVSMPCAVDARMSAVSVGKRPIVAGRSGLPVHVMLSRTGWVVSDDGDPGAVLIDDLPARMRALVLGDVRTGVFYGVGSVAPGGVEDRR